MDAKGTGVRHLEREIVMLLFRILTKADSKSQEFHRKVFLINLGYFHGWKVVELILLKVK